MPFGRLKLTGGEVGGPLMNTKQPVSVLGKLALLASFVNVWLQTNTSLLPVNSALRPSVVD